MSFSAKVVADSTNNIGDRITTMVVTFPRFILAEFNTHRMFSRNSASSRAIPFDKLVQSVSDNPFIPIAWQKDHKGMQGTEYFTDSEAIDYNVNCWLAAKNYAIRYAKKLHGENGIYEQVTKQICNRLLEPYMWHTVIVTATDWENFFALRCPQYVIGDVNFSLGDKPDVQHYTFRSKREAIILFPHFKEQVSEEWWRTCNRGQAEIHMQQLAELMWDAYNESTPKALKPLEWHIPFGDQIDFTDLQTEVLDDLNKRDDSPAVNQMIADAGTEAKLKVATARCAQISYTIVGEDGQPMNYKKLVTLHDRLEKAGHWSPFEHCAQATDLTLLSPMSRDNFYSGNFKGFLQYRKMFKNENITRNEN